MENTQQTDLLSLPIDVRTERNYSSLRKDFIEYLVNECDYARQVAENSDDWRDEFIEREYGLYVAHNDYIENEFNKRLKLKEYMKHQARQVEINGSDDERYI